jgi:chromodomain-helicase-DNA-binding protein 4
MDRSANQTSVESFTRTTVKAAPIPPSGETARLPSGKPYPKALLCLACNQQHITGSCPLKTAGIERCNICGLAHYGYARVCPHFKSETMVRTMLEALKESPEPKYIIDQATKYLRGLKGHLVQEKKKAQERALSNSGGVFESNAMRPIHPPNGVAGPSNHLPQGYQVHQRLLAPTRTPPIPWEQLPVEERLHILTFGSAHRV